MLHAEGRYHSWITGIYWTLTVMTTLGFGDITFTNDIGRLFSIIQAKAPGLQNTSNLLGEL